MELSKSFEAEKNRKALTYTVIICALLLLMFILISWKVQPPPEPVIQDLIEINLGNNEEGFGTVQPLIKGERSPVQPQVSIPKQAPQVEQAEKVTPDDNAEENAAPVTKPEKTIPKVKPVAAETKSVVLPAAKPAKPKITYDGPGKGGGNNSTEDNGYKYQGNKPGGTGDAGDPTGNKDSYGNSPGGKVGGPRVTSGNRKVIRYYSFTGELPKATIYALIKVSPSGQGTLIKLVKPSTNFSSGYATAVSTYLRNVLFDPAKEESNVTVVFNFNVN
jgi:hypothetical protein